MSNASAAFNQRELGAGAYYLRQLAGVLQSLDDAQYGLPLPALGGSVGGHTRHIIEHYRSIAAARETGRLCFEERPRDPEVERSRGAALAALQALLGALAAWDRDGDAGMDAPLRAATTLSGDPADAVAVASTFRREWFYVILHTVHHLALVAVALRLLGLEADPALGRAPATLHFEGRPVDHRGL